MNVVFIHQNFPGQFRHIAAFLAADPSSKVVAIGQASTPKLPHVSTINYLPSLKVTPGIHPYLATTEAYVINGQAVAMVLLQLKQQNFRPDVIFAHAGWGEALFVKDVFPDVPLIGYFEFFYRSKGADMDFDPEYPLSLDHALRLRTRTAIHFLSLEAADAGITPTHWQRSVFPKEYQPKLQLIHEGVDVHRATPNPDAVFQLPNGLILSRADEVITYVSRNLEPYRGFHIFMRAAEQICERRPNGQILVVGGDEVSYGNRLPDGQCYREKLLKEVSIDASRVHFLGRLPYAHYLKVLQISSAHIYLTVPFVLSWSMLEAMAVGCLVIGSNTAPVREIIRDRKNGLLVDFFSPTAIADAVDEVLQSPEEMQRLRATARQTILENYSTQQGLEKYRQLLKYTASR